MALKTTKTGQSKQKKKAPSVPFYKNEKFRFVFGIFVLLVSAYLLLAFLSFLFYGAADQSKLGLPWRQLVLESEIKVGNIAGKTGAYLSEVIMNRGFGFASFIIVYLLFISGFKIMGYNLVKYRQSVVISVIVIIWFSIATGFAFPKTSAASFIYPGGQYGFILSNWFSSLIGKPGLILLLFISALTFLVVRYEKAFLLLKSLFTRKEKMKVAFDPVAGSVEEENVVNDNSISKVIEKDGVIQAIFEPDGEEEEQIEINQVLEHHEVEEE
jgi:DNA segregation ATPase FtsK/SpoIIIE, S-DNA-T family